jgi:hypothetical protein
MISDPIASVYLIRSFLLGYVIIDDDVNAKRLDCLSNVTIGPCKNSSRPKLLLEDKILGQIY